MTFSNPVVAGEELIRSAIRSEDYVAGTSGWRIARDGAAEFVDVTVRGDFESVSVDATARLNSGALIIEDNDDPVMLSRLTISTLAFQGSGVSNQNGQVRFLDHATAPRIGLKTPIASSNGVFFDGGSGFLVLTKTIDNVNETWTNFPFASGWTVSVNCAYKLMPDGIVRFRGIGDFNVDPIPDGTEVFTLPAGYRPTQYTLIPIAFDSSVTKGRCEITSAGVVSIYDAPNDLPCFDNITFSTV